jgi:hypothetical protein
MESIFNLLNESGIIEDYEILSLLQDDNFYYLKIKSNISGGSILHIRIYLSDSEYNYSFHWQKETGELIARWDNAPHHQEIVTFPHHIHFQNEIKKSYSITLKDVLEKIKEEI